MRAILVALVVACTPYSVEVYGVVDGVDPHGVNVASNGTGINAEDVGLVVESTWVAWSPALYHAGIACSPSFAGIYISLQQRPFELPPWGFYGGLTEDLRNAVWGGGYIVVRVVVGDGWRVRLAHELGHVTLILCDLPAFESDLLAWATAYGIPY